MQKGGLKRNGTKGPVTATTTQCHATRPKYHVSSEILGGITKFKWKLWIKEAPFSSAFPYAMTSKKYLLSYGLPQKYTTAGY